MAGKRQKTEKLNLTLERVANILNLNGIKNWFVMYGTLLGIHRGGSCIEGDDDIDIIINVEYDQLKTILEKEGFGLTQAHGIGTSKDILKTEQTEELSSVDFYISKFLDNNTISVPWQRHILKNCFTESNTFVEHKFHSSIIYFPNDYENKIIQMYGKDWRIPANKSCKRGWGRKRRRFRQIG